MCHKWVVSKIWCPRVAIMCTDILSLSKRATIWIQITSKSSHPSSTTSMTPSSMLRRFLSCQMIQTLVAWHLTWWFIREEWGPLKTTTWTKWLTWAKERLQCRTALAITRSLKTWHQLLFHKAMRAIHLAVRSCIFSSEVTRRAVKPNRERSRHHSFCSGSTTTIPTCLICRITTTRLFRTMARERVA